MTEHDGKDRSGPGGTVIAVLTYRRGEDLKLVLPRLAAQAQSINTVEGRDLLPVTVLVVDNDPAASALTTVEEFARTLPSGLLTYVHEPKPGIAAARNRALTESSSKDLLVFIDDDEIPSEHWLSQLLDLQRTSGAAAVVGPVISEYEHAPEPWISAGRFFQRRRLATGTPLTVAATNNLLLHLPQIRDMSLEFDERFGLSGGSDTLFTRQLVKRGGAMLWCDEAVVVDRVPAGRLTRDWVLRRALRSGNSAARVRLELERKAGRRLAARGWSLASGVVRVAGGVIQLLAGVVARSQAHRARGLRTAARGLGMATGAVGYIYHEYRRT